MARVPVAQQEVAPSGIGAPLQSPAGANFRDNGLLGQTGQSVSQFGDTMADIAVKMQHDDNVRALKQLEVQWKQQLSAFMYGDQENPGYLASRGQNAIDGYGGTRQQIEDARRALLATVQNERVRENFGLLSAELTQGEYNRMSSHLVGERITADNDAAEARMTQAINDAVNNPNDPLVMQTSLQIGENEIFTMAETNGWSEDVVEMKMGAMRDTLVSSVIEAVLPTDADRALALFEQHGHLMTGVERGKLAKVLDDVLMPKRAQEAAEHIMSLGLDYSAQLAYAREFFEGKTEDAVISEITQRYNEGRAVVTDARQDILWQRGEDERRVEAEVAAQLPSLLQMSQAELLEFYSNASPEYRDEIFDQLQVGETLRNRAEQEAENAAYTSVSEAMNQGILIDAWIASNPDQWRVLDDNVQLVANLRALEDRRLTGETASTDWTAYDTYMRMSDADLKTGGGALLAEAELALGPDEFTQFRQRFDAAVDPNAAPPEGYKRSDARALLHARLDELDIDANTEASGQITSAFERGYEELLRKGPVVQEDVDALLDTLTEKVITGGGTFLGVPFGWAGFTSADSAYSVDWKQLDPLPTSRDDLQDGQMYALPDGSVAKWSDADNGFVGQFTPSTRP